MLFGKAGPMSSQEMQDSLRGLYLDARAADLEMGGYFYKTTANGPILFARLPPDIAKTDACQFRPGNGGQPALGVIVGYVHTHQAPEGVQKWCPVRKQYIFPDNFKTGGGSDSDWVKVDSQLVPEYTVDRDRKWRLDPGVPLADRKNNPNRWLIRPNACAVHG